MLYRGAVVEKICEYLIHKNTYEHAGAKDDVPEFSNRIPPEMALEL
jgi:transcription elongation factor B subunit 1